jgi:hypothetical protein
MGFRSSMEEYQKPQKGICHIHLSTVTTAILCCHVLLSVVLAFPSPLFVV